MESVARTGEMIKTHKRLVGNPEVKRLFGRPRCRRKLKLKSIFENLMLWCGLESAGSG
jgi:hypothetical protein